MAEVNQVGLLSDQAMGIQKVSPKSRGSVRDHDMGTFRGGQETGSSVGTMGRVALVVDLLLQGAICCSTFLVNQFHLFAVNLYASVRCSY